MNQLTKRNKIIITIIAIASIITIIIVPNLRIVQAYGLIRQDVNGFIFEAEVVDCEVLREDYFVLNPPENLDKQLINGLALFNLLTINSVNNTYDPKVACFERHEGDVTLDPGDYNISAGVTSRFSFDVFNNQDNRLFYEVKLINDCEVARDFFTGYLDPGEAHKVFFDVNCDAGVHNVTLKTVFVDELVAYHTVIDKIKLNVV